VKLEEQSSTGLHEALLARLPPVSREAAVLDVGCGSGAWLQRLQESGFQNLWGIDRDADRFGFEGARFVRAYFEDGEFGLGERRFALITAIEVIEHIQNTGLFLKLLARHLDPSGFLLITTPNVHSLLCRLRYLITGRLQHFGRQGDPTHIHPIFLPLFDRMVDPHGLRREATWTHPETHGGTFSKWPSRLAARVLRAVMSDPYPGDVLCMYLRSQSASSGHEHQNGATAS